MSRCITRFLVLAVITSAFAQSAAAQQAQRGTVTGQVISGETRTPVASAQVFVVGTNIGALTNNEGRYTLLNVPAGPRVVRVQLIGYTADDQTVTVPAGGSVSARFELKSQAVAIQGVVVTAMGIERKEKSLGYAVQSVGKVALERSPEVNVINAIAAQSPGVQVTSASGQPGASSRIVIRGESSFQGDGQPLFVIDGIPISIAQDSKINNNPLEFGGMGNRGMDIDPNNIEEISILRGAAATALYGSRAAFGAIVIKTKTGKPGQPTRYSVSSRVTGNVPILAGIQEMYGQGLNGYFCNGKQREQGGWCQPGYPGTNPNPVSNNSWGPHRDSIPQVVLDSVGDLRFRDARKDFYEVGNTYENSVNIAGSLRSLAAYNFNLSRTDQSGLFPGTKLGKTALQANISTSLSNSLRVNTTLIYSNTLNIMANEGYSSLTRTLFQLPLTRDISQATMPDGSPTFLANNSPHPKWSSLNQANQSSTGRWIGATNVALTLVPGVTLSNRLGIDTYTDERLYYENERPWLTQLGTTSGGTDQQKIYRRQLDNTTLLTFDNHRFGQSGITVSGLMGSTINSSQNSNILGTGDNILVPGNYNVQNFSTTTVTGNLATRQRLIGVYGQATADYHDYVFLTLTGRNDWSSTLPKNNNNYFYPSASLSFVFTDAFKMPANSWLQYGKVRLSRSKVGSDAPPYRLDTRYNNASGPGPNASITQGGCCGLSFPIPSQGGVPGYVQSATLGNPDLRPESTVETELGLEMRMFNNKLRPSITYYDKKSYDQIFSVPSSAVTGYTNIFRNAGDLANKGWEVSLASSPIRTRNYGLDVIANWSRNHSRVLSLAPGVTSIFLTGYSWPQIRIMEGYSYGVIWGYGYKRDENGDIMICGKTVSAACPAAGSTSTVPNGSEGWPMIDDQLKVLGETQQKWQGSLNTTLRYKAFSVSSLVDTKQGGKMLNFDLQYNGPIGKAKITEHRGDLYTFKGVNVETGQPNDVKVERNEAFWRRYLAFDLHENQIEDASLVRLRELSLRYDLPRFLAGRIGAQNASLSLGGRNLHIWTKSTKGDPDGSNFGSANAGGSAYAFFTAPQTRSFVLSMRADF